MSEQLELENIEPPIVSNDNLIQSVIKDHINEEAEQPDEIEPIEELDFNPEELKDYTPDEKSKFHEVKESAEPTSNEAILNLIDTDIIVTLTDILLSRLFFFAFNRRLGKDVAIQDFELTPEESKSVSKLLKEYMKTQEIKITPAQALILGVLAIYGGKAILAYTAQRRNPEEVKTIKQQTKSTGRRGRPPGVKNKPKEEGE